MVGRSIPLPRRSGPKAVGWRQRARRVAPPSRRATPDRRCPLRRRLPPVTVPPRRGVATTSGDRPAAAAAMWLKAGITIRRHHEPPAVGVPGRVRPAHALKEQASAWGASRARGPPRPRRIHRDDSCAVLREAPGRLEVPGFRRAVPRVVFPRRGLLQQPTSPARWSRIAARGRRFYDATPAAHREDMKSGGGYTGRPRVPAAAPRAAARHYRGYDSDSCARSWGGSRC